MDHQASIVQLSNGHHLFFYHDGPSGTPNRKQHAECLYFNADGTIQSISRSSSINTLKNCWNS